MCYVLDSLISLGGDKQLHEYFPYSLLCKYTEFPKYPVSFFTMSKSKVIYLFCRTCSKDKADSTTFIFLLAWKKAQKLIIHILMKYTSSVVFTFFFFIHDIHKSSKKCRAYTQNLRQRYYYDHVAGLSEFYWSAYEFLKVSLITQYKDASMS